MSSAPDPTGEAVSPELYRFFQVELANEPAGGVSPSTLDSAHDSLCQAPEEVIRTWFCETGEYAITHPLIEFGGLLQLFGPDARLDAFVEQN